MPRACALTVGMATYDDFDGVYFTLQALRLYHDLTDTELVVVDNFGCEHTRAFVEGWAGGRYVRATGVVGTAAARERIFAEAHGAAVLVCDAHVLLAPGAIARLRAYYREHPDTPDLLQGPLVYDDLRSISTHFDPVWREQMWGVWATDDRGLDPRGEPFEIPMQGLGVFSCRRDAWPGFNPAFRGFGGEEGYLHEKFRRRGGRCLCLPWLRWVHRFGRPAGVPYPLTVDDKLRNYLIGHGELGLDLTPIVEHFSQYLPPERVAEVAARVRAELAPDRRALTGRAVEPPADRVPLPALPGRDFTPFPAPAAQVCLEAPSPGGDAALPLVSCLCPTYGRPPDRQWLLEEAIESFLRQSYPHRELVILNDCPAQELVCDAPGVRVVNIPRRYPTLGDKYNALVALARGELLARWDDDDISLPWRLALSVEKLGKADYFNPRCYWFWDPEGLHGDHAMGYAFNTSLVRRAAFAAVGGSPALSLGEDAVVDGKLAQLPHVVDPRRGAPPLPRDAWYYIYRWGVSPSHLSGRSDDRFYQEIGERPVVAGRFALRPHWRTDYVAATRPLLAADAP
ncbi:MAG TPA: glycosyltransferase [Thermomicrobiaceae bacterium]|nr:glycosyltransferase [Thermomicrobiaceae bacterium]